MSSAITYVILSLGWSLCAFGGWTNSYYHVTDQKPHLSVSFGLIVRHLGVEFDHTWLSMFPLWSFPVSFPAGGTLDLLSYVGQVQQRGRSSVFGPDQRRVCLWPITAPRTEGVSATLTCVFGEGQYCVQHSFVSIFTYNFTSEEVMHLKRR